MKKFIKSFLFIAEAHEQNANLLLVAQTLGYFFSCNHKALCFKLLDFRQRRNIARKAQQTTKPTKSASR